MAKENAIQKVLPVIATILVVGGVVAIARLNVQETSIVKGEPSPSSETTTVIWTILQSGTKLSLTSDQGEHRDCELPDGYLTVDHVSGYGIIARNATGARMFMGTDCARKDAKLVAGLANPSGARAVTVSAARRDGAGVLVMSDGKIAEEITLRGKNSRPYRDPEIIGWLDENVFVATAFQGDARYAITVQTTGNILELMKIPENAVEFRAGQNALWYVTVTPGEGIELGPRGPSELHRVSPPVPDTIVVNEDGSVIERVLLGPDGTAVYVAGGTMMRVNTDGKVVNAGTGIPLGWTDTGELLVNRNGALWALTKDGASREITTGPVTDATAAWVVSQTLDEPVSTK